MWAYALGVVLETLEGWARRHLLETNLVQREQNFSKVLAWAIVLYRLLHRKDKIFKILLVETSLSDAFYLDSTPSFDAEDVSWNLRRFRQITPRFVLC